jgi:hypothetical protein
VFRRRRTYDIALAVMLRTADETEFYTRNVVDFRDAGFARVVIRSIDGRARAISRVLSGGFP